MTNGALASAAVGATNVAGTVVAASLMDRAGRKQLLTLSFTGAAISRLRVQNKNRDVFEEDAAFLINLVG